MILSETYCVCVSERLVSFSSVFLVLFVQNSQVISSGMGFFGAALTDRPNNFSAFEWLLNYLSREMLFHVFRCLFLPPFFIVTLTQKF